MKDIISIYLDESDQRAEKYRQMDKAANDGHLPKTTVLQDNICFCLVKPTYDQCADPIYTQVRANLKVWDTKRALWHKQSSCASSCACKSTEWFHAISRSESELTKGLLCEPAKCPELLVDEDNGVVPEFHKPGCCNAECTQEECLATKLKQMRACTTEFSSASTELVRY
jgi:hypothetical protein